MATPWFVIDEQTDYSEYENSKAKLTHIQVSYQKFKKNHFSHYIKILHLILDQQKDPALRYQTVSLLIPFLLKHSTKNENGAMNRDIWVKNCNLIREAIVLDEIEEVQAQSQKFEGFKRPDLIDLFVKLDSELYKALQLSSNLNLDYIERLNDEHKLLTLGEILRAHILKTNPDNSSEHLATLSHIFLSHLYFKHDYLHEKIHRQVQKRPREDHQFFYIVHDSRNLIAEFVAQVMNVQQGDDDYMTEVKQRTILF